MMFMEYSQVRAPVGMHFASASIFMLFFMKMVFLFLRELKVVLWRIQGREVSEPKESFEPFLVTSSDLRLSFFNACNAIACFICAL